MSGSANNRAKACDRGNVRWRSAEMPDNVAATVATRMATRSKGQPTKLYAPATRTVAAARPQAIVRAAARPVRVANGARATAKAAGNASAGATQNSSRQPHTGCPSHSSGRWSCIHALTATNGAGASDGCGPVASQMMADATARSHAKGTDATARIAVTRGDNTGNAVAKSA